MRFNAVYRRLYFCLGSALVALMDAPPLAPKVTVRLRRKWFQTISRQKI